MATAGTTLERASFANPISGWTNLRLVTIAGIALGDTLTITKPDGSTLAGVVKRLGGNNGVYINVSASSKPSGSLLLPIKSTVA